MEKTSLLFLAFALFVFSSNAQTTVSDADGNQYNIVTIGTQMWTKENLKTTKYSDGTDIDLVEENNAWSNLFTGAYCQYPAYGDTYGNLYNFYAVADSRNICPTGWHVATYDEWNTLATYLGGQSVAASKLKETGIGHWGEPNTDATNESGFTAFGGGYRKYDGVFYNILDAGYFWQGTETGDSYAWYSNMDPSSGYLYITDNDKKDGMSVRCIKNPDTGTDNWNNQTFELFPNPAQNFITLKNIAGDLSVEIYNIAGQLVYKGDYDGESPVIIDISNFESGSYIVRFTDRQNNIHEADFIKI